MIKSKLLGQYELETIEDAQGGEIVLRVNIYECRDKTELVATAERLEIIEVTPLGCDESVHVEVWVRDDFACSLLSQIHKHSEMDILDELTQRLRNQITNSE